MRFRHTAEAKRKIGEASRGNKYSAGKRLSLEHRKAISDANKGVKRSLGYKHTAEAKEKMSITRKGHIVSPETRQKLSQVMKGRVITSEMRTKISQTKKGKPNLSARGVNSNFWRGGISSENKLLRNCMEYRLWRESIFKRDKFICVWCKTKKGPFNADHIKPFAYFPELRFAIDNGRTLCVPCHRKTDTFGWNLFNKKK